MHEVFKPSFVCSYKKHYTNNLDESSLCSLQEALINVLRHLEEAGSVVALTGDIKPRVPDYVGLHHTGGKGNHPGRAGGEDADWCGVQQPSLSGELIRWLGPGPGRRSEVWEHQGDKKALPTTRTWLPHSIHLHGLKCENEGPGKRGVPQCPREISAQEGK